MQLRRTLRHSSLGNMHFLLVPHPCLLNETNMWQVSASNIPLFQVDGTTTVLRGPSQRKCRDPECQISLAPARNTDLRLGTQGIVLLNFAKQITTCIHVMVFLFSDNIICVPKFLFLPVPSLSINQIWNWSSS